MAKERVNEIEKIILSGRIGGRRSFYYDEAGLRRKLRALVRKAYVVGYGAGMSPASTDKAYGEVFRRKFGCKP